jgi:hypothetical protein
MRTQGAVFDQPDPPEQAEPTRSRAHVLTNRKVGNLTGDADPPSGRLAHASILSPRPIAHATRTYARAAWQQPGEVRAGVSAVTCVALPATERSCAVVAAARLPIVLASPADHVGVAGS